MVYRAYAEIFPLSPYQEPEPQTKPTFSCQPMSSLSGGHAVQGCAGTSEHREDTLDFCPAISQPISKVSGYMRVEL